MKTKEFIKAVEELGYEARIDDEWVEIIYKNKTLAHIFTKELYRMSSYYSGINCGENAGILFTLIFQYACTPIEDRKNKEKRYYLRHKWISDETLTYLHFNKEYNGYMLNLAIGHNSWKKEFTEEEIKGLKKTFNTDLNDFEIVEVENED